MITAWNPTTDATVARWEGPVTGEPAGGPPTVWCVAFLADGRYLAAVRGVLSYGRRVPDGVDARRWRLDGSPGGVFAPDTCEVAFMRTGAMVAAWGRTDTAVYESPAGPEKFRYRLESWGGSPMAFARGSLTLIAPVGRTLVALHKSYPGERRYIGTVIGLVRAVAVAMDDRTVLAGGKPGKVEAWNITGGRTAAWDFGVGTVHGLAVAPDGCTVAVAGGGGLAVCDLG